MQNMSALDINADKLLPMVGSEEISATPATISATDKPNIAFDNAIPLAPAPSGMRPSPIING